MQKVSINGTVSREQNFFVEDNGDSPTESNCYSSWKATTGRLGCSRGSKNEPRTLNVRIRESHILKFVIPNFRNLQLFSFRIRLLYEHAAENKTQEVKVLTKSFSTLVWKFANSFWARSMSSEKNASDENKTMRVCWPNASIFCWTSDPDSTVLRTPDACVSLD